MKRVLLGISAVLILALPGCTRIATTTTPSSTSGGKKVATKPLQALPVGNPTTQTSKDPIVRVVQAVRPAVVNVTTDLVQQSQFGGTQPGQGVGTGFIISPDGIVVTNYHVVEHAQRITVITPGTDTAKGTSYQARVIGGDQAADLAVLKIDATGLPTVHMGDSSQLLLGQRVVAIGYALALKGGPTVSSGIVSALGRVISAQDPNCDTRSACPNGARKYSGVIQTDAAINPGNSGGPLLDLNGNVIGIDTAGAGQAENIGFAIAINDAKPTIFDAARNPSGPVPYLGVVTEDVTPGLAAQFGLPATKGAYVVSVAPGGPAEKAGISGGDVIVGFDGNSVPGSDQLGTLIRTHKPGDSVQVEVVSSSAGRRTVDVTLGVNPLP
ncbi:MAG: trypsin-like peptidase domain-containing protein [Actinomycetota bacterium]|nr:trypsin-like peptidase domain-containing protein [Actinomycetota bacterium]